MPDLPKATPHYSSERAWLDHLRVMAELPYPSWALMPAIARIVRHHIDGPLFNFGWSDRKTLQPLAMWVSPVNDKVYRYFMSNTDAVFDEVSIRAMLDSRGRLLRTIEAAPAYEQSGFFAELLNPSGVRWGLSTPVTMHDGDWVGFLTVYRPRERGPYAEGDQARIDKVSTALSDLDRRANPLRTLPAAGYREAVTATLLLHRDGRILAQSPDVRDMLFLSRRTGMGPPEWARPDWHALPPEINAAAESMFADPAASARRELRQQLDWGRFDFILEKMPLALDSADAIVCVTIRHHEPLDIAVASGLWGWPMSPREKRILIASARNPSRAELAEALGLAEGTLKEYIGEMQGRLGVASRQELIDRIAGTQQAGPCGIP